MPGWKMLSWPDLYDKTHSYLVPSRPLSARTTPLIPAALGHPLCNWLAIFMLILTTGLATGP